MKLKLSKIEKKILRKGRKIEKVIGKLGKKKISPSKIRKLIEPKGIKLKKVDKKYVSNLFIR